MADKLPPRTPLPQGFSQTPDHDGTRRNQPCGAGAKTPVMYQPLGPEWLDAVAALEKLCFSTPWSGEQYRALHERGVCLLFGALREKNLLGYVALSRLDGDDTMEIFNIAVSPIERGKGIAGRLLRLCLLAARKAGGARVLLEVRESNVPAIALYRRAGFTLQGRRKRYYTRPVEDALLYRCDLKRVSE